MMRAAFRYWGTWAGVNAPPVYDEWEFTPPGHWRFLGVIAPPIRPLAPGCLAQSKVKHRGWRKR